MRKIIFNYKQQAVSLPQIRIGSFWPLCQNCLKFLFYSFQTIWSLLASALNSYRVLLARFVKKKTMGLQESQQSSLSNQYIPKYILADTSLLSFKLPLHKLVKGKVFSQTMMEQRLLGTNLYIKTVLLSIVSKSPKAHLLAI